jgi:hypothetical protein
MRQVGLAALLLATLLVLGGCNPTLYTETGIVTGVTSASLVDVDSFQLRTSDGRTLTFTTKGLPYHDDGFPVQHLREHQALAQPVMVTYRVTDGRNDVIKLQDAPATR